MLHTWASAAVRQVPLYGTPCTSRAWCVRCARASHEAAPARSDGAASGHPQTPGSHRSSCCQCAPGESHWWSYRSAKCPCLRLCSCPQRLVPFGKEEEWFVKGRIKLNWLCYRSAKCTCSCLCSCPRCLVALVKNNPFPIIVVKWIFWADILIFLVSDIIWGSANLSIVYALCVTRLILGAARCSAHASYASAEYTSFFSQSSTREHLCPISVILSANIR